MTKNIKPYWIIFLLSLSALSFEIIIARIFSYILAYHFVFIIIAFVILSYSFGQFYTSRMIIWESIKSVKNFLSFSNYFIALQLFFPISIAAIYLLPSWNGIGTGTTGLILYIVMSGITFFLIGVITAYIFQANLFQALNLQLNNPL